MDAIILILIMFAKCLLGLEQVEAKNDPPQCPKCLEGKMYYNFHNFLTSPPLFGHRCDKCAFEKTYKKKYNKKDPYENYN